MTVTSIRSQGWFSVACALALLAGGCTGAEGRKVKHLEKGQAFLAAENYEKARVEFRNALQIAPNDGEARYENGVVLEKLGHVREAGQFYQGAIDVSPDNIPARVALGRIYVFAGAAQKALDTVKPSLDKHPDDARLLTIRAAARVQLKDAEGAFADAERAVSLAPDNEDAVAVLAGVEKSRGELDKAQKLLEDTIKRRPQTVEMRLALAQLDASRSRSDEVERLLLELTQIQPKQKVHRLRLAQFYASAGQVDEAERTLRAGIKDLPDERDLKTALVEFLAARRGRDAAEKQLAAFIAADPKDYELRFAQAQFYEQGGDLAKAETVYREVIASAGLDAPGLAARDRLAALRVQQKDVEGAQKLIAEVLAKSPRDDDALILRGSLALARNDPRDAIADLRSVLRDQPNAVGVMRNLARAHLANGEPALAEETMRGALEANPKDPAVRLDLALLLSQLGKADAAKPVIDELVKQQPTSVPALDTQFKVSVATQDYATAKLAADAIVAQDPKSALGYYYQGELAEAQKRTDEALKLYSASLDIEYHAVEPLRATIRLLITQKRIPEALKRLDDLAARDPKYPMPLIVKGEVLLLQHQAPAAVAAFQAASERAPEWMIPYHDAALAEISVHDDDAAEKSLKRGIAAVKEPMGLEIELATLYEHAARYDDAIKVYEAVLAREPKSDVASNNLAMLLVTRKEDPASLQRAKDLSSRFASSNNPNLLDTYGWVLYKRGEADAAVSVLQSALAKSSDSPISLYHLGMAEALAGQAEAARNSLSRSLQSGKSFAGIEEAKATLDKLAKSAGGPPPSKS